MLARRTPEKVIPGLHGECKMVETARRIGPNSSDDAQYLTSDGLRWRVSMRPHVWRPPTDVYETEEAVIIRVEIAGMRESDFSISLDNRSVVIRGTRPDIPERRAYHQMESPCGEFSTELDLPGLVNFAELSAAYRDGFLRVVLPKAQPHKVKIED